VQLCLPIATAENPRAATRRRSRDRLGEIRAGAPKAIDKTGTAASATMEEVVYRLTDALLKVASNKGAPGPDGQTIEVPLEQRLAGNSQSALTASGLGDEHPTDPAGPIRPRQQVGLQPPPAPTTGRFTTAMFSSRG
jgi:hypothetical protein